MSLVKYQNKLSREVMDVLSLEVFNVRLNRALSNRGGMDQNF